MAEANDIDLAAENRKLQMELDEAKSTLAVAECVKESLVEMERQKASMAEELATMQQLLNEAHDEASATRTSYEHELAKAKAINSQLEHQNQELKVHLKLGSQGVGSGASAIDRDTILGGGAAVLSDATKSFARKMKSNLLPSVVGLSSEKSSTSSLMSLGGQSPSSLEDGMKKAYEDTELLKSIVVPLEEQIGALKDKLRETDALLTQHEERQAKTLLGVEALAKWLEGKSLEEALTELLDKSASADMLKGKEVLQGDTYLAMMSVRYSLMRSELSAVKKEAQETLDLLSRERSAVKKLKQEAVVASSELVRSQREHLAEITKLQSVLTEEQKAEIAKPQSPAPATSATAFDDTRSITPLSSPDSSPSHTASHSDDSGSVNMARIVSNVEWEDMQSELNKVRALLGVGAGDSVVGSDRYRALQAELIEIKKQKALLVKSVEKYKDELQEEAHYRREVEEKWNERAEAHRSETEELTQNIAQLEVVLQKVQNEYHTLREATKNNLMKLTKDREKIVYELRRVQEENDILVGKHSTSSEAMQNEVINLPEGTEEMQLLLLNFREDLITAKIAKERAEEKLKHDTNFLHTQLRGEEIAKKSLEDHFAAEIEGLNAEIRRLSVYKKDLEKEQRLLKEVQDEEERQRRSNVSLQQQLDAIMNEKKQLETKLAECKAKLSILQQELDNSVAVQTDFVRLSQSLQMELEKIRQSETEVRWQHEDDVNECQSCKSVLNMNKRKHHCRHCGRIFCSDCVSKSVPSGPRQRPQKVCDVCHTLLVQNSAPYFSTEVPQQQA